MVPAASGFLGVSSSDPGVGTSFSAGRPSVTTSVVASGDDASFVAFSPDDGSSFPAEIGHKSCHMRSALVSSTHPQIHAILRDPFLPLIPLFQVRVRVRVLRVLSLVIRDFWRVLLSASLPSSVPRDPRFLVRDGK